SFFIPVVSGRRRSLSGSPIATQAAVPIVMAEAQPQVTMAAGAPRSSAIRAPTFFWSSERDTKCLEACSIASTTSGGIIDPPRWVTTPTPLITGRTPRRAYMAAPVVVVGAAVARPVDAAAAVAEAFRNLLRLELVGILFFSCTRVTLALAGGRNFWFHPRTD